VTEGHVEFKLFRFLSSSFLLFDDKLFVYKFIAMVLGDAI